MGSWVTTATGCVFDYDLLLAGKPQRFPVTFNDIAIPQSRSPRWMGVIGVTRAEHSTLTSRRGAELCSQYRQDERYAAGCCLIHDAMESFQSDLPRPLKLRASMREYCEIEETGLAYLMRSFGLGWAWADPRMRELVDQADAEMLAVEIRDVVPPLPDGYDYGLRWPAPEHYVIRRPATEHEALAMFHRQWMDLGLPTVGAA